jgi:hypothetical protein
MESLIRCSFRSYLFFIRLFSFPTQSIMQSSKISSNPSWAEAYRVGFSLQLIVLCDDFLLSVGHFFGIVISLNHLVGFLPNELTTENPVEWNYF